VVNNAMQRNTCVDKRKHANMQTTICPRAKKRKKDRKQAGKQASLESSIKNKQKVSQIMELLHTCKRLCAMLHDTKLCMQAQSSQNP
jgi:hypothetical protein